MPSIEVEGDTVWFESSYREREQVKQVCGAKYDRIRQQWHAPLSWATCVQARGVFGDALEIGPALLAWANTELADRVRPCMALRDADQLPADHWVAQRLEALSL